MITQVIKHKKKTFQAADFSKFISKIHEQEALATLAIQELNKLQLKTEPEYKIEVFEGKEGLKSYFDYIANLLEKKQLKEYLVFGSNLESIKTIKFFLLSRIKSAFLLSKEVDYRTIWDYNAKSDLFRKALSAAGKHKFLPKESTSKCTTIVFNEYVAVMFNTTKPVVVRIQNKNVAETYRNQFNLVWNIL